MMVDTEHRVVGNTDMENQKYCTELFLDVMHTFDTSVW